MCYIRDVGKPAPRKPNFVPPMNNFNRRKLSVKFREDLEFIQCHLERSRQLLEPVQDSAEDVWADWYCAAYGWR